MSLPQPIVQEVPSRDEIGSSSCSVCYLCGATGTPIYENLKDRLFGAPGIWNLKRCPELGCGLIWLDPMPSEVDIVKAYKNYFTHIEARRIRAGLLKRIYRRAKIGYLARKYGYDEDSIGGWAKFLGTMINLFPGRASELDFGVMYLPFRRNGRLLDVGCGSGQALQRMAEHGWLVQGVDFDSKAVGIAQKKGLDVRLGALEAQIYPADFFDAVTMSHLIEHVHDPVSLLTECRRILRPGGRVVIVTPNSDSWGRQKFGASWMHLDPPRHLRIFNGKSLRTLAERCGFGVLSLSTTIRDADGLFIGSQSIERTGQHRMEQSHGTLLRRLWGGGMQFAEWALLRLKPGIGEESVLIGTKEAGTEQQGWHDEEV